MMREFLTSQEAADELSSQTGKKWTVGHIHQKAAVGQLPVCFLYRGYLGLFSVPMANGLHFSTKWMHWVGYLRSNDVQTTLPTGRSGKTLDLLFPSNVAVAMPAHGYGLIEIPNNQELRTTNENGESQPRVIRPNKWLFHVDDLAKLSANKSKPKMQEGDAPAKPWLVAEGRDPDPDQPWYVPARYFARQLVMADSTLLSKRLSLADKVSNSLVKVGIYKRGGKKSIAAETILKAFSNVMLD